MLKPLKSLTLFIQFSEVLLYLQFKKEADNFFIDAIVSNVAMIKARLDYIGNSNFLQVPRLCQIPYNLLLNSASPKYWKKFKIVLMNIC